MRSLPTILQLSKETRNATLNTFLSKSNRFVFTVQKLVLDSTNSAKVDKGC
uniref:Bm14245 n=1 Tax=Brugia malayi TaxID=6279 RepID=A0A1I9G445_BRUMA|nr:Bm14245 [Brugia malayi]